MTGVSSCDKYFIAISIHPHSDHCLNLLRNCYHTHTLFYSFHILHHLLVQLGETVLQTHCAIVHRDTLQLHRVISVIGHGTEL